MTELLQLAVQAHGGLDRWQDLTSATGTFSVTGAIWHAKGRPDIFKELTLEADLHQQHVVLRPSSWAGLCSVYRDDVLSLVDSEGRVIERRPNPASMYAEQAPDEPWSDLQAAYFATEALWTYLTLPFLYTHPGFVATEVEPREENGETWRRLQVDFPDTVASHTGRQTSAFGPDGLLRRHEYSVDILGGATGALYATDLQTFDGIVVPTRRRIFAYDESLDRVPQPLLVGVDVLELSFR